MDLGLSYGGFSIVQNVTKDKLLKLDCTLGNLSVKFPTGSYVKELGSSKRTVTIEERGSVQATSSADYELEVKLLKSDNKEISLLEDPSMYLYYIHASTELYKQLFFVVKFKKPPTSNDTNYYNLEVALKGLHGQQRYTGRIPIVYKNRSNTLPIISPPTISSLVLPETVDVPMSPFTISTDILTSPPSVASPPNGSPEDPNKRRRFDPESDKCVADSLSAREIAFLATLKHEKKHVNKSQERLSERNRGWFVRDSNSDEHHVVLEFKLPGQAVEMLKLCKHKGVWGDCDFDSKEARVYSFGEITFLGDYLLEVLRNLRMTQEDMLPGYGISKSMLVWTPELFVHNIDM